MSDWRTRFDGLPDLGALREPEHLRDRELQSALREVAGEREREWVGQVAALVASGAPRAAWPPDVGHSRVLAASVATTASPTVATADYSATLAEMTTGARTFAGGPVICYFTSDFKQNVNPTGYLQVQPYLDGAAITGIGDPVRTMMRAEPIAANTIQNGTAFWLLPSGVVASGSHTITLRWAMTTTANIGTAQGTRRQFVVLEL